MQWNAVVWLEAGLQRPTPMRVSSYRRSSPPRCPSGARTLAGNKISSCKYLLNGYLIWLFLIKCCESVKGHLISLVKILHTWAAISVSNLSVTMVFHVFCIRIFVTLNLSVHHVPVRGKNPWNKISFCKYLLQGYLKRWELRIRAKNNTLFMFVLVRNP